MYRFLRFIMLVPLVGCVGSTLAQQTGPTAAKASFTMRISLQHETVKAGAEILLMIDLTNTSDSEIKLFCARPGPHSYIVRVQDSEGKAPPLTAVGKALRGEPLKREGDKVPGIIVGGGFWLSIAPGQTRRDQLSIDSEFDLSQPGTYTIQLGRVDPATKAVVKSNTVTLTVTN